MRETLSGVEGVKTLHIHICKFTLQVTYDFVVLVIP